MNRDKAWQKLEDYIATSLKEIDPNAKHTKASGGSTIKGDIQSNTGTHWECKQRNTDSITIKKEIWNKLCQEIPLHSNKIPILALENKNGERFAVLDLDEFLNLYKNWYNLKFNEGKMREE